MRCNENYRTELLRLELIRGKLLNIPHPSSHRVNDAFCSTFLMISGLFVINWVERRDSFCQSKWFSTFRKFSAILRKDFRRLLVKYSKSIQRNFIRKGKIFSVTTRRSLLYLIPPNDCCLIATSLYVVFDEHWKTKWKDIFRFRGMNESTRRRWEEDGEAKRKISLFSESSGKLNENMFEHMALPT